MRVLNATAVAGPVAAGGGGHSGWNSPVPYLFGGLAAMLGLIAFALLILACSYWKLSGYLDSDNGGSGGGGGSAAAGGDDVELYVKPVAPLAAPADYEAKVVVIMAGDEKPTYLATPIASRQCSFNDGQSCDKEEEVRKCEDVNGNEARIKIEADPDIRQ